MPNTTSSTLTPQALIIYARPFPWTKPALGLVGYEDEPAISFVDDIVKKIMAESNPWKWNAVKVPRILTQPYQQDYPTNISQNTLGWLQSGVIVDVNNNTQPIPRAPMTVVKNLLPTSDCDVPMKACWIANSMALTGLWPGTGILYQDPLIANGGGPGNNPFTAITDPNGNIQVVTTYGVTGNVTPTWPAAGAQAGTTTTDGTVVWTVQDPNGVAFRLSKIATNNSQVWAIHLVYQTKPPNITSLSQTVSPIPDDLNYLVKQGFLAHCWKHADSSKFPQEYKQWLEDIQTAMGSSDREAEEFGFSPAQPIQGGGWSEGGYGYAGWPGWTSGGG